MDEKFDQAFQQAAVFQKMWTDAFGQMAEVWTRASPGKPPPDTVREMRSGMLKVLTESWDQFMRTPQFLEYMKQSTDGLLSMRKMTADAMTRTHHEAQSPAREDIDAILLAIRRMEHRLLDKIEEVDTGVMKVGQRVDKIEKSGDGAAPARKSAAGKKAVRKAARKPASSTRRPGRNNAI